MSEQQSSEILLLLLLCSLMLKRRLPGSLAWGEPHFLQSVRAAPVPSSHCIKPFGASRVLGRSASGLAVLKRVDR
ncbi:hypothetical protein KCU99_g195, partial [Aureobasidium melanogenum]